jgi:hypothetical protein
MLAAVAAGAIAIGVTKLGIGLSWPHPSAISLGVSTFLLPILATLFGDNRPPTWSWTLPSAAVTALIAGYFASLLE